MGRYYSGNIRGKYWFGIQSSDCMTNYGAYDRKELFNFCACGCNCDDVLYDKIYCEDCYNSYEEHIQDIREQEDDAGITDTFIESDETTYELTRDIFESESVEYIFKHKDTFEKYIDEITFDEDYEYDIEWNEDYDDDRPYNILADICMLKQIQHFFDKTNSDTCIFFGED